MARIGMVAGSVMVVGVLLGFPPGRKSSKARS